MPRPSLVHVLVLAVLLAGCTAPDPSVEERTAGAPTEPSPGPLVLTQRTECTGINAIVFADGAAMRPFVPANWSFTSASGREEVSILRVHAVDCAEGRHVALSTPMRPDEASAHHHDNPDVVLGIWSDDLSMVTAWRAAGFPAWNATVHLAWGAATSDVHVAADAVDVLRLSVGGGVGPVSMSYAWPAAYAAGTQEISWAWGHENATAHRVVMDEMVLGPAAPFPGLRVVPWWLDVWSAFDLSYGRGTPPQDG